MRLRCQSRCIGFFVTVVMVVTCACGLSAQSLDRLEPAGVRFLENRGQVVDTRGERRPDILYTTGSAGVKVYLRKSGISYVYLKVDYDSTAPSTLYPDGIELPPHVTEHLKMTGDPSKMRVGTYRMDMELVGANPEPTVEREKVSTDHMNFYLPHCPDGLTNVRSYERVIYREVYPKIDLVFKGGERGMKYDFVVHPGGRVEDIRMRYIGADRVEKNPMGSLEIENMLGRLEEGRPVSYQGGMLDAAVALVKGEGVTSSYVLEGDQVSFRVGRYDRNQDLVIDPALVWATFYGGSAYDFGLGYHNTGWGSSSGMAVDLNGNIMICAGTLSTDFPVTPGAFQQTHGGNSSLDGFIVSFDSYGERRWSTLLGGNSLDYCSAVACDGMGNVAAAGSTGSSNFPVTQGAFQGSLSAGSNDLFISQFDSTGARLWATLYGGSNFDYASACDFNSRGNVHVGGTTFSSNFPVSTNAFQRSLFGVADPYIIKMDSRGNRLWATYYGSSNHDWGGGLLCDDRGNVHTVGTAYGATFPIVGNAFQTSLGNTEGPADAFVARFDSSGNLVRSTFLGGSAQDWGTDIGVDAAGNISVTGYTGSSNFPVTANAVQTSFTGGTFDGFLVSFDSAGNRKWGTYYGGTGLDYSVGLDAAPNGHIYIVGRSQSPDLMKTPFPLYWAPAGWLGLFAVNASIAEFDSTGAIVWDTYYTGIGGVYANGIAGDGNGSVIVSGYANDSALPVRNAFQSTIQEWRGFDAFIARFCNVLYPWPTIEGSLNLCEGDSVVLTAPAGYETYRWIGLNNDPRRTVTIKQSSSFQLYVENGSGCAGTSDLITVRVNPKPLPLVRVIGSAVICHGDSVTLDAARAGIASYSWSNGMTGSRITIGDSGIYSVEIVDTNGCRNRSSAVTITVRPRPNRPELPDTVWICPTGEHRLDAGPAIRWEWSNGVTTRTNDIVTQGIYWVRVFNEHNCFAVSDTVTVLMYPANVPVIEADGPLLFCAGDSVVLDAGAGYQDYLWSTGERLRRIIVHSDLVVWVTVVDSNSCLSVSEAVETRIRKVQPHITALPGKIVCQGDSVVLDAGGGQYRTYRWSTGDTATQIKVGASGKYYLTVMSMEGCPGGIDSVEITVNPRPVSTITGPTAVCASSQGRYNVPQQKGLNYQWNLSGDGSIQGRSDSSSVAVRWGGSGGGKLTVTITNPVTRCNSSASIDVAIGTSLSLTITAERAVLCPGDSVELDAGEYTQYRWSTGERTRRIYGKAGVRYTVTVSDADGCHGISLPLTLTEIPLPAPFVTALGATIFCGGDSVVLDAGAGYSKYQWSVGGSERYLTVKDSGSYAVTVTNAAGCSGTSSPIAIRINPTPLPTISGPSEVCQNSTTSYTVVDIPGSNYQWTVTGGIPVGSTTASTLRVAWGSVGSGTIDIEQTSSAGCSAGMKRFDVTIGDRLKPTVIPSGDVKLCAGETITLDAGSGYTSYAWSNGMTSQAITVAEAGSYEVFVRDASGCSGSSDSVYVTLHPLPVPAISLSRALSFIDGDSVVLDAGSYASYEWMSGQRTRRITVKKSGNYSVSVIDSNGCRGVSQSLAVTVRPKTPEIGVATAQVELPLLTAKPGDRVLVPVILKGSNLAENGVTGYQLKLRYNRSLLAPIGTTPIGVIDGEDRVITMSGALPAVGTGGSLTTLEFVAALGNIERTSLALEDVSWTGADVQTTIINGEFVLDGLCRDGGTRLVNAEGSFGLKSVHPNPAAGRAEVEYEVVEIGRTQIWLTDMLGRQVLLVMDGLIVPGRYKVSFDVRLLGSGTYVLTLQSPTDMASVPLRVIE